MNRCTNYKKVQKHNGPSYPIWSDFIVRDNTVNSSEGFICLTTSQKFHETMVGNDDGEGQKRGKLVKSINKMLYNPVSYDCKEDQLEALWGDERTVKFAIHKKPEDGAWLWNADFYEASIEDLQYLKKVLRDVHKKYEAKKTEGTDTTDTASAKEVGD